MLLLFVYDNRAEVGKRSKHRAARTDHKIDLARSDPAVGVIALTC